MEPRVHHRLDEAARADLRLDKAAEFKGMSSADWIVVRIKPAHDALAAHNVRRQQHECYFPRYWDAKRKRRRLLFTGYGFVLVHDMRFFFLRSTYGIASVVMVGERPARVPAPALDQLRKLENDAGNIVLASPEDADQLEVGRAVKLLSGPFANQIGKIVKLGERERVKVLLDFAKVETTRGQIEALAA